MIEEIRNHLKNKGRFEVKFYTNTFDFLEHFLEWYPQVVIMDVDLIQSNTLKLIRILQKLKKDLKIFLIVSSRNMKVCSQALSMGIITYLLKPISTKNICSLIHSTLKTPYNKTKEVK